MRYAPLRPQHRHILKDSLRSLQVSPAAHPLQTFLSPLPTKWYTCIHFPAQTSRQAWKDGTYARHRLSLPARWSSSQSQTDQPIPPNHDVPGFPDAAEVLGLPPLLPRPNKDARNVAVLGGGITGLCTAFDLAHSLPHASITLYEKSTRLGGWADTEVVEVEDGEVLFEWGPRTLRPDPNGAGRATLQLISKLGIAPELLFVPKSHPASQNRFLYYPDHLVRMPSPYSSGLLSMFYAVRTILSEPIFSGLLTSVLREPSIPLRSTRAHDESVGSFLKRRFGSKIADNLASALFHGIYAGDIYSLSARTCLPKLWYLENRDLDGNGILTEMLDLAFRGRTLLRGKDLRFMALSPAKKALGLSPALWDYTGLLRMGEGASAFSLRDGLGSIATALEEALATLPNVTIKTASTIVGLNYDSTERGVSISADVSRTPQKYDYVVSSLRPGVMQDLINTGHSTMSPAWPNSELSRQVDKAVTVMVVNLYYSTPNLLPPDKQGFGYLVPRSVEIGQNPERALGVIFASALWPRARMVKRDDYLMAKTALAQDRAQMNRAFVADAEKAMQSGLSEANYPSPVEGGPFTTREAHEYHTMMVAHVEAQIQKLTNDKQNSDSAFVKPGGQDSAPGTKLGVMLGGHWWDGWKEADYPSEEEAIEMAKSVLNRHLGITEQPAVAKAKLQRDCIPQYPVNYRKIMGDIHEDILIGQFRGKLKVAGPWWQGAVGFNDCVRKAREVSLSIENKWDDQTGLEEYSGPEQWFLQDKQTGKIEADPMGGQLKH